jgi:hypothetical protein
MIVVPGPRYARVRDHDHEIGQPGQGVTWAARLTRRYSTQGLYVKYVIGTILWRSGAVAAPRVHRTARSGRAAYGWRTDNRNIRGILRESIL